MFMNLVLIFFSLKKLVVSEQNVSIWVPLRLYLLISELVEELDLLVPERVRGFTMALSMPSIVGTPGLNETVDLRVLLPPLIFDC